MGSSLSMMITGGSRVKQLSRAELLRLHEQFEARNETIYQSLATHNPDMTMWDLVMFSAYVLGEMRAVLPHRSKELAGIIRELMDVESQSNILSNALLSKPSE